MKASNLQLIVSTHALNKVLQVWDFRLVIVIFVRIIFTTKSSLLILILVTLVASFLSDYIH